MNATIHGAQRLRERAPGVDVAARWVAGRPATEADYLAFSTWPRPGVEYRVVVVSHKVFLLARGRFTGEVVTLFSR